MMGCTVNHKSDADQSVISAENVCNALKALRVPLVASEYDLHGMVMNCLTAAGIAFEHEKKLGPRCRIDLLAGRVGIELKRGTVNRAGIMKQLERYAASEEIIALVLVSERAVSVPSKIGGKPVCVLCLRKLWGIAL